MEVDLQCVVHEGQGLVRQRRVVRADRAGAEAGADDVYTVKTGLGGDALLVAGP